MKIKKYLKKKYKSYQKERRDEKEFEAMLRKKQKMAEREARLSQIDEFAHQKAAMKREALEKAYKQQLEKRYSPPKPKVTGSYNSNAFSNSLFGSGGGLGSLSSKKSVQSYNVFGFGNSSLTNPKRKSKRKNVVLVHPKRGSDYMMTFTSKKKMEAYKKRMKNKGVLVK